MCDPRPLRKTCRSCLTWRHGAPADHSAPPLPPPCHPMHASALSCCVAADHPSVIRCLGLGCRWPLPGLVARGARAVWVVVGACQPAHPCTWPPNPLKFTHASQTCAGPATSFDAQGFMVRRRQCHHSTGFAFGMPARMLLRTARPPQPPRRCRSPGCSVHYARSRAMCAGLRDVRCEVLCGRSSA